MSTLDEKIKMMKFLNMQVNDLKIFKQKKQRKKTIENIKKEEQNDKKTEKELLKQLENNL